MSNMVILKKSSVAGKIPIASDLQPAELAVNLVDQKLYSKRTDGTVVLVGVGSTIINPTLNRFSGTGSQTAFTLSAAPVSATALIVNISGVVQTPTVDYTVSGTTLTFTTAPPAGTNNITVQNLGTAGTVNVPADGSVTAASMAPGAAVGNIGFTPYNATNPSGFITSSASITGNAATATKLQTARTINGVSFDGSANITVSDSTKLPTAGGTMTGAITFAAGQTWPTFNQSTTGNAATATKLQTARTINGVSFDGSANITVADSTKQPLDADLTAIAALSGTSGLLKKTAADTWTLDTNTYVTSSGVTSVTGTAPIISSGGNTPAISISAATTGAAGSMSAADKSKLDGIASGATANTGTVTSVTGSGSYGGLTLSGTVTSSGSLTLGGTPTGTWPISVSGSSASCTGNAASSSYASSAGNADTLDGYHASSFLQDTSHSLASNGYQKFSNGLIIQWGSSIDPNYVTFPIAFPNACLNVQLTRHYDDSVVRSNSVSYVSKTQFRALYGYGGDTGYWFAIGY